MVRFRKYHDSTKLYPPPDKKYLQANYWKLEQLATNDQIIKAVKLAAPSLKNTKLSAHVAKHLHSRLQRELVLYGTCTDDELERFCTARHIGVKSRKDMIADLERADTDFVFKRFFALPAELREVVYAHYFASLDTCDVFPHEPPLTQANRLVRHESLPLFYSTCDFKISNFSNFFYQYPDAVFARIQKITISKEIYSTGLGEWRFEIMADGEVRCSGLYYRGRLGEMDSKDKKELDRRAQELSAVFQARGEKLDLRQGDRALVTQLFRWI